jgi:hypothetical protein
MPGFIDTCEPIVKDQRTITLKRAKPEARKSLCCFWASTIVATEGGNKMLEKKVFAFHYAWYGTPWGPAGEWRAWNHRMTKARDGKRVTVGQHDPDRILYPGTRDIGSMLYPMDGPFDSRDVSTVRRQLSEAEEAGLDGFMLSWWGPGHQSDKVLQVFMEECPADFICVNFETPYTFPLRDESREKGVDRIRQDMLYVLRTYSDSDRWIKMDGRPLIVIWRVEQYEVEEWACIKDALVAEGYDPFWLAQMYDTAYVPPMDALCTYEPFSYTLQGVDLEALYKGKKRELEAKGAYFAATANPGFDNRALHKPGLHLPRENGGYYRLTWQACLCCDPDFVVINSYNEWGESSVIESTRQFGKDYLEYTREFVESYKRGGD